MPRLSSKLRTVAGAIIVLGVAAMIAIVYIAKQTQPVKEPVVEALQAPSDGSIAIGLTEPTYRPFDVMTIRAAGLDPAAATSVVFTSIDGRTMVVPAMRVTASEVDVPVPPAVYDRAKGGFGPEFVFIKVVQMTKTGDKLSVRTSGKLAQRLISTPSVPAFIRSKDGAAAPKGLVTLVFAAAALGTLNTAAEKAPADQPKIAAAFSQARQGMEQLIAAVRKLMADPKARVELPAGGGRKAAFTTDDLAWLDSVFTAYLGAANDRKLLSADDAGPLPFVSVARAQFTAGCRESIQQNTEGYESVLGGWEELLCQQTENQANAAVDAGGVMSDLAKFAGYFVLIPSQVALSILTGGWSVAWQVFASIAFAQGTDLLITGQLPKWDALTTAGATIADGYLEVPTGAPSLSLLDQIVGLNNIVCKGMKQISCLDAKSILSLIKDRLHYVEIGPDGTLVEATPIPDYGKALDLDPVGPDKVGYEVVSPKPEPAPKPKPKPVPDLDITPTPSPTPKPTPGPTPLTCSQEKEAALKQCQAGCPAEMTGDEYSECTSGCSSLGDLFKKADCVNGCIGAWTRSKTVRSDCMKECLNAYYATVCP